MSRGLSVISTGMVTAVGLDALSSCAAMRARVDGFDETRFLGVADEWQIGGAVPLPRNWIGQRRLAHLAAGAVVEALRTAPETSGNLTLILCLPEEGRKGALISDADQFAVQVKEIAELNPQTPTRIVEHGRPSGFVALERARKLLASRAAGRVLIVGVDSYLTGQTISHYAEHERLLTPANANGFIPGEAAAAILCVRSGEGLQLGGIGLAREEAYIYNGKDEEGLDLPLRGDGMTSAYKLALDHAGLSLAQIEYRISDLIGEQYFFKQAALVSQRLIRGRSEFQDLWSPGESLGNVGAAVVPLMIGHALIAARKGYAMGSPVLIDATGDDGACGAATFFDARVKMAGAA